jgi:CBS domain-containing protein
MKARDIMVREVITVGPDEPLEEACDRMQMHNVGGLPVVAGNGRLMGIVTQDDLVYGPMGGREGGGESERVARVTVREASLREGPRGAPLKVSEIMTSPAVSVEEDTPLEDVCSLMWALRIHRLPVVRGGTLTGIVSAMDVCRAIAEGRAEIR